MKAVVYSNSVIGLVAFLLSYCLHNHWQTEHFRLYALMNGTATIGLYNLHRFYKIQTLEQLSPLLYWVRRNMFWVFIFTLLNVLVSVTCCLLVIHLTLAPILLLGFSSIIAAIYVVPLFGKPLRDWPYFKSIWIGLVWTAIVVVFPRINEGLYDQNTLWIALSFFFYFFACSIPADVRDLKYDSPEMHTLPQVFGIRAAKIIAIFAILMFYSGMLIFGNSLISTWILACNVFLYVMLLLAIYASRKEQFYTILDMSMLAMAASFL